jgi:hypothetical protein
VVGAFAAARERFGRLDGLVCSLHRALPAGLAPRAEGQPRRRHAVPAGGGADHGRR